MNKINTETQEIFLPNIVESDPNGETYIPF